LDPVPYQIVEFQATPNPNAVKCVLDSSPTAGSMRSYSSAAQAGDDPLGSALFAIPGVTNLLIHDGWIAVGKDPGVDWKSVKAGIKKVLGEAT